MRYNNKRKNGNSRMIGILLIIFAMVIVFFIVAVVMVNKNSSSWKTSSSGESDSSGALFVANTDDDDDEDKPNKKDDKDVIWNYPRYADDALQLTDANIYSSYAVLLDVQTNEILAYRGADLRMSPASMTKLMTLLVAVENISDFNATYTLTYEMISPLIEQEAARAGFEDQETVSITDLLYGMILPSGADATIAIVQYVAETEENFVNLMNKKAKELGMDSTHFSNATGLYDKDHYSNVTDIALLMKVVMQNDICRKILSTVEYQTTSTQQHPGGIL